MPKFFAATSKGLADAVESELKDLQLKVLTKNPAGVWFESNWAGCYKANYFLRSATRVLYPVLDFKAFNGDDVYRNTLRHNFTRYFNLNETFAIDTAGQSEIFRDTRYAALKVKDAIADQFREKFGMRPDVDRKDPSVIIHLRVLGDQLSLAIDTSGGSLSQRGYRQDRGEAPLREHLAAGILRLIGWTPQQPLVDLMCGSGTFLLEAGWIAAGVAPGHKRRHFSFQSFENFDKEVLRAAIGDHVNTTKLAPGLLFGYDKDSSVLRAAELNARRAGLEGAIKFFRLPVVEARAPVEQKGVIVVNPPYGERLGAKEPLSEVYKQLGDTLKNQFKGWTCWVLSGNEELTRHISLKSTRRIPLFNGNIECRLLKYELH